MKVEEDGAGDANSIEKHADKFKPLDEIRAELRVRSQLK